MTPAWVCFDYRPEDIARNAYAGLIVDGERLFPEGALDRRQLRGHRLRATARASARSRETAVQAEKWSGIRIAIAASFAPIHARNNINQGVLMGDHDVLRAPAGAARRIPLDEFTRGYGPLITRRSSSTAASSPSPRRSRAARSTLPRAATPARAR